MTSEEAILHTLHSSGITIDDLDLYVREDVDRMTTRLTTMHDRMKAHLADLLRPALTDETARGQGSFDDGGEQFVGGDFAGDLDEDFFGFRELGLDREFGMASLTVPFHILQNRLGISNQQANAVDLGEKMFKEPPRWPKVNVENVEEMVGIVRGWFEKRLKENGDRPLTEDLELPPKQRPGYGRARVPATGKIGDGNVKNASPLKKGVAAKNPPAPKPGGPTPGDKNRKKSIVTTTNGDGTAPLVNGTANTIANPGTPTPAPPAGDGSPVKKGQRPNFKTKSSNAPDLEAEKDTDAPADNSILDTDMSMVNGVEKVNGVHVDGDASMMSPESL
jgi:transcriptional activator SPT7